MEKVFPQWAPGLGVVTFHARSFHLGEGLTRDGDRILGAGDLRGEWMDGTPWVTHIWQNEGTVLVPEPATLSLLSLGGLAMLRRRK